MAAPPQMRRPEEDEATKAAEKAAEAARRMAAIPTPIRQAAQAYDRGVKQAGDMAEILLPALRAVAAKDEKFRASETLDLIKSLAAQKVLVASVQVAVG